LGLSRRYLTGSRRARAAMSSPPRAATYSQRFRTRQIVVLAIWAAGMSTASPWLFIVVGILSTASYAAFLAKRLTEESEALSPIWLYSLTSLFRMGIAPIWLGAVLMAGRDEALIFGTFSPGEYLFVGFLVLLVGEVAFYQGYLLTEHRQARERQTPTAQANGVSYLPLAVALIVTGWFLRLVWSTPIGSLLRSAGQISGYLRDYAVAAGIWLWFAEVRRRDTVDESVSPLIVAVAALATVDVAYTLQSYMKQSTIVALLPIISHVVTRFTAKRSSAVAATRRALGLVVVGIWAISFLWTYSQIVRPAYWRYGAEVKGLAPTAAYVKIALSATIPGTDGFARMHRFPENGAWSFIARNQWIGPAAWVVADTRWHGVGRMESIRSSLISLIPRLFWPSKPQITPSRDLVVRLGLAKTAESATTAMSLGLGATLFWNGGWPLLVIGMLANGSLLCLAVRVLRPFLPASYWAMVGYMVLSVSSLRWFESAFDGNLALFIYVFLFFVPISILTHRGGLRRASASPMKKPVTTQRSPVTGQ